MLASPLLLKAVERPYSNRIYIGPDIFYRDYHENLKTPGKSDESGSLVGFQTGYDYIKHFSAYVGGDLRFSSGKTDYDGAVVNLSTFEIKPHHSKTDNTFFNVEGRLGYTLGIPKETSVYLSPFGGIGWFYWKRDIGYLEEYQWKYYAFGLRFLYQVTRLIDIGINLKLMKMFDSSIKMDENFTDVTLKLGNKLQGEIELPMSCAIPQYSHIDIRIVPYYRSQDIGESNTVAVQMRGIGPLIVREPSSNSWTVGSRIELGYNF